MGLGTRVGHGLDGRTLGLGPPGLDVGTQALEGLLRGAG